MNAEGLRPTTDRTKETLFNWLMNDIRDARCLDAFAGAGSLGFEALSRGAKEVVFFEQDKPAARTLEHNCKTLSAQGQIMVGDSLALIRAQKQPFDIVFADPPFKCNLLLPFVTSLLNHKLLSDDGVLYVEHEAGLRLPDLAPLQLHREKATTQFRYALYRLGL